MNLKNVLKVNKKLIDVVNFNADASCFSADEWLNSLEGGSESTFCQWLFLYVKYKKKITLGLVGATIADIKSFNPEAIELINLHPDIFEIILRPWSHDIGIYRDDDSFLYNVKMGISIIEREFVNISRYFLSPEFMINSKQIQLLGLFEIEAIFINPNRYDDQTVSRIPKIPYEVMATSKKIMNCISVDGKSAREYLKAIQVYDCSGWNEYILSAQNNFFFSWRDGESSFLIPEGNFREEYWLKNEADRIERVFLSEAKITYLKNSELEKNYYRSFPIHSFLAWMQEMKMLWFIDKINAIEKNFNALTVEEKNNFLHLINSDILASVEKISPEIDLMVDKSVKKFVIYRQERGFEGEEFLSLYDSPTQDFYEAAFFKKYTARKNYLKTIVV